MAIKLEGAGGGGKALMAWPLGDKLFFCGFPKPMMINAKSIIFELTGGHNRWDIYFHFALWIKRHFQTYISYPTYLQGRIRKRNSISNSAAKVGKQILV